MIKYNLCFDLVECVLDEVFVPSSLDIDFDTIGSYSPVASSSTWESRACEGLNARTWAIDVSEVKRRV